jgi:hypothetical protein
MSAARATPWQAARRCGGKWRRLDKKFDSDPGGRAAATAA